MKQYKLPKYQRGFLALLAAAVGAGIGAIASNKASKRTAGAAKEAGQYQLQAAQETIAEQRRQFNIAQQNAEPWLEAGRGGLSKMQAMLYGPEPSKYAKFVGTKGWKPQQQNAQQSYAPQEFTSGNQPSRYNPFDVRRRDFGGSIY